MPESKATFNIVSVDDLSVRPGLWMSMDYELRFSDSVVMVNINSILKKGDVTKSGVPHAHALLRQYSLHF